jgi:hypothetical protein
VVSVELDEVNHRATVTVSEDQQSLAIGRGGQNVRLAAKLTGWNIDIASLAGESVAEATSVAAPTAEMEASEEEVLEAADEGKSEMQEAMTDVESDTVNEADTVGTESLIIPDSADEASGELTMEEEAGFTDNGTIADSKESRDESAKTTKDQA